MMYLYMFVYMLILPITYIILLYKILDKLNKTTKEKTTDTKSTRIHPSMKQSNYDNAFGGRTAYEIYKNKDGLYEPITPSRGIKIEKKEE